MTSDLHFNHENILKYEPVSRPFATVEEMNEVLIQNWNSKIKPEDIVYVLGDLCMGRYDTIEPIIKRLNGKIILVRGNHDTPRRIEVFQSLGIEVRDIEYLRYKGRFFILCHFPIASEEFMDMVVRDNSEVVNLYGHVHHNAPKGYHKGTYHVGVDTNDLMPISLNQIWEECWPAEQMKDPFVKKYKERHEKIPNGDYSWEL
jgi:calcineurin-like phosphoesterase family protein